MNVDELNIKYISYRGLPKTATLSEISTAKNCMARFFEWFNTSLSLIMGYIIIGCNILALF